MHKNQPLPDQNVVKNENKFKSKLIEKPCSEYCYSLQQQNNSEDTLNETITKNKRNIESNEEDSPAKRTINSPSRTETRMSLNNSYTEKKNTRSNKNSVDSSPSTTSKASHIGKLLFFYFFLFLLSIRIC